MMKCFWAAEFVAAGGVLSVCGYSGQLPTDGTVKVPGGKAFDLLGKTFTIAECGAYEGSPDGGV